MQYHALISLMKQNLPYTSCVRTLPAGPMSRARFGGLVACRSSLDLTASEAKAHDESAMIAQVADESPDVHNFKEELADEASI